MQTNKVIKKRSRVRSFMVWTCLLAVVGIGMYSAYRFMKPEDAQMFLDAAMAKLPAPEAQVQTVQSERKIYPYSIVRGGMRSREEVYANIRTDHVVAQHYSDFDVSETRVIQAPQTRSMYVSYRIGDEVYWTAKAIQIPKGETLITDGTLEARTRCGNMLSATPMTPTSDKEPDVAFFDIPENEIPGYSEPEQFIGPGQTPMTQFGESAPPTTGGNVPSGMPPGNNIGQYLPGLYASSNNPGTGNPGTGNTPYLPGTPDLPGTPYDPVTPYIPGEPPVNITPSGPSTVFTPPGASGPGGSSEPGGPSGPFPTDTPPINEVPEPGAMILLLTGLAAVVVIRIRQQNSKGNA